MERLRTSLRSGPAQARWLAPFVVTITLMAAACGNQDALGALDASDDTSSGPLEVTPANSDLGLPDRTIRWADVQPLYEAHCGHCHSTGSGVLNGETNFATEYSEATKPSKHCTYAFGPGLLRTVAHCVVERITAGTMPPGGSVVPEEDVLIMRQFVLDGLLE